MFTPYEYTWTTPGKGLLQLGAFVLTFLGVVGLVKLTYPDQPSYPREFEDGLERELGGAGAQRVCLRSFNSNVNCEQESQLTADIFLSFRRQEPRVMRIPDCFALYISVSSSEGKVVGIHTYRESITYLPTYLPILFRLSFPLVPHDSLRALTWYREAASSLFSSILTVTRR